MLIFIAMLLGLGINYRTGGLPFSAILCVFAGIFLVMPGLLNIEIKDFAILKKEKKLTAMNVLLNVVLIPALFIVSGFLFFPTTQEIRYSLAMLAILPGGGLLMGWIRQSQANPKFGFALFVLNMTLFIFLFLGLHYLILQNFEDQTLIATQACELETLTHGNISCDRGSPYTKPLLAYLFLIILPFLVSRAIRFFPKLKENVQKYISPVAKGAIFLIITYIFSLQGIHGIFDQNYILLIRIFSTVLVGYLLVFSVSFFLFKTIHTTTKDIQKAVFRNGTIRFITLGLVFGVLYVPYLGPTYITIFASSYVVQTLIASTMIKILK